MHFSRLLRLLPWAVLSLTASALCAGEPGDSWFVAKRWEVNALVTRGQFGGQNKLANQESGRTVFGDATGLKVEASYAFGRYIRYGLSLAQDRSDVHGSLPNFYTSPVFGAGQSVKLGTVNRTTLAFEYDIHPGRDERWDWFCGPGLQQSSYSFSADGGLPAAGITAVKIKSGLRLTLRGGVQFILGRHWAVRAELRWAQGYGQIDTTLTLPLVATPQPLSSPLNHAASTLGIGATYRF